MKKLWAGLLAILATACAVAPAPTSQLIRIEVATEVGEPLPGVEIVLSDRVAAVTGAEGVASVRIGGPDGTLHSVQARCPVQHFASPAAPLAIQKTTLSDPKQVPTYHVQCTRQSHVLVVAIRAKQARDLPVHYLGREIAKLDESGAATVAFELGQGERVELMLDTSQNPELQPSSPVFPFRSDTTADDVVALDVAFTLKKPPKLKRWGPPRPTQL